MINIVVTLLFYLECFIIQQKYITYQGLNGKLSYLSMKQEDRYDSFPFKP